MANFKVVIGLKNGKSFQKEIKDNEAEFLIGRKIDDKVSGEELGYEGYEFVIKGGSDFCGVPMRKDVQGQARKKILSTGGVGFRSLGKGQRLKKSVCGNTVTPTTAQINLKVTKEGAKPLIEEAPKEEAKAQ